MPSPSFAELPPWLPYLAGSAIAIALLALFGLLLLLRGLRELRSGVAEEVRRELAAGGEAARVQVQSPLEIKAHAGVVTRREWEETHGRISRERREVDAEIKRVEAAAEKRTDKIEAKLDENSRLTTETRSDVRNLTQQTSSLNQSITQFLRDAANHRP